MPAAPAIRPAAVAGTFYPADPEDLTALVRGMLADVRAEPADALGAITPHAGLVYSGRCAARVWARVRIPETVVIIAPNHTGRADHPGGASAWSHGAFDTPLGEVAIADAFLADLERRTPLVAHDPTAHRREHAIEVELPFLRLLAPHAAIAPIVLAWDDWTPCEELGRAIAETVKAAAQAVLLVASSDMTHYESAATAARKDRLALAEVERLDGGALLRTCRREGVTMCGRAPAATVLEATRLLGATRATVVDYRHSGMVTGDDREVVAYAGVVIQ
jgi:AmmeMemoRadiSam system protein B